MTDLQMRLTDCDRYWLLRVSGEIDCYTAPGLRSRLSDLISVSTMPILVDLSGVTFCDSSGLSVTVVSRRLAAARGLRLGFVGLNDNVAKIFRITGMDQCLELFSDLSAAVSVLP
jgi:anti-sigma B factor antagonist